MWSQALKQASKQLKKGFNSLVILVALELRKYCNKGTYYGASLDVNRVGVFCGS